MKMMRSLEPPHRAARAGTEDPVCMQVQGVLQDAHGAAVVARMQRAPGACRGRQRQRDEQRDKQMS